ncbi:MAG: hypothetical protein AAFO73_02060 [Pseudomonadota bacterium]
MADHKAIDRWLQQQADPKVLSIDKIKPALIQCRCCVMALNREINPHRPSAVRSSVFVVVGLTTTVVTAFVAAPVVAICLGILPVAVEGYIQGADWAHRVGPEKTLTDIETYRGFVQRRALQLLDEKNIRD